MFGKKDSSIKISCPVCDKSTTLTQMQNYSIDYNNENDVFRLKNLDDLVHPKMEEVLYDSYKKFTQESSGVFGNISIVGKHRTGGLLSEPCMNSEKYFKVFWHYFVDHDSKTAGITFRLIEEMLPARSYQEYSKIIFVSKNDELEKEIQELKNRGQHYEIIAIANRELSIIPENNIMQYEKAEALIALECYEDALLCYDNILKTQPDHDSSLIGKGVALRNLGRYEEAILCYDKIPEDNPNYPNALSSKGVALRYLDRFDEALKCYDESLKMDSTDFKTWTNKGSLHYRLNDLKEAIACYNEALKIDPNHEIVNQLRNDALNELSKN